MWKKEMRAAYSYDGDAVSRETGLDVGPESMTQQQFAEECDINTIVRRFGLTGQLPNGVDMPLSGDFTAVTDFQSAMNLVKEAEAAFLEVPAATRERFGHDPGKLIAFLEDDNNREEAIKLGLVPKPVVPDSGVAVVAKPA